MSLRAAIANIHNDRLWWRKILIGGALMLTIVGYPLAEGLVVENLDNARKGFPTPLPPWREWFTRYITGLFALLIDFVFFFLPILVAGRGGDTIRTGRHMKVPFETPLNNLYLAMLDRLESSIDQLGDSTGRLDGLV